MDPSADLLSRVARLGKALVALGEHARANDVRAWYVATRDGRRYSGPWDEALLDIWEVNLRLNPDKALPVRPRGDGCTCRFSSPITRFVFPGGARIACNSCGAEWLV